MEAQDKLLTWTANCIDHWLCWLETGKHWSVMYSQAVQTIEDLEDYPALDLPCFQSSEVHTRQYNRLTMVRIYYGWRSCSKFLLGDLLNGGPSSPKYRPSTITNWLHASVQHPSHGIGMLLHRLVHIQKHLKACQYAALPNQEMPALSLACQSSQLLVLHPLR